MSCSLWPQKSQLEGYEVMQVLYIFAYKDIFDIFWQNEKTNWMNLHLATWISITKNILLFPSCIMYKYNEYSRVMNTDGFD